MRLLFPNRAEPSEKILGRRSLALLLRHRHYVRALLCAPPSLCAPLGAPFLRPRGVFEEPTVDHPTQGQTLVQGQGQDGRT